jgi:hypothetical protein
MKLSSIQTAYFLFRFGPGARLADTSACVGLWAVTSGGATIENQAGQTI